jgi:hypothetical protein
MIQSRRMITALIELPNGDKVSPAQHAPTWTITNISVDYKDRATKEEVITQTDSYVA